MEKSIKKYTFRTGLKPEVEVVSLETLTKSNQSLLTGPHRTDFYHLFLFGNCSVSHLVDFEPVKISPKSLLFLGKEMVHQFDKSLKYKGRLLVFTDSFFCATETETKFLRSAALFNSMSGGLNFKPGIAAYKTLVHIYDLIEVELSLPPDKVKQDILKNLTHCVMLLLEREKNKQGPVINKKGAEMNYTFLFKELLESDFRRSKKVYEYATRLNISEKKLGHSTAKILGKSPKELIDERVLLEAKRLLIHGSISVKEIGFQLGFEEPTNFIKYFHKHAGNTPAEFRQKHLSHHSS